MLNPVIPQPTPRGTHKKKIESADVLATVVDVSSITVVLQGAGRPLVDLQITSISRGCRSHRRLGKSIQKRFHLHIPQVNSSSFLLITILISFSNHSCHSRARLTVGLGRTRGYSLYPRERRNTRSGVCYLELYWRQAMGRPDISRSFSSPLVSVCAASRHGASCGCYPVELVRTLLV